MGGFAELFRAAQEKKLAGNHQPQYHQRPSKSNERESQRTFVPTSTSSPSSERCVPKPTRHAKDTETNQRIPSEGKQNASWKHQHLTKLDVRSKHMTSCDSNVRLQNQHTSHSENSSFNAKRSAIQDRKISTQRSSNQKRSWERHRSSEQEQGAKPTTKRFKANTTASQKKIPTPKRPPSQASIDLSKQLVELSKQKRLKETLELYWKNNDITDSHHTCIVVDCCARCGVVDEAENIVNAMTTGPNPKPMNVETQTALMKVYAHVGCMDKAIILFRNMLATKDRKPNVRTLNTLLRGCLWTPSTMDQGSSQIIGGVVTSEQAWKLFVQDRSLEEQLDCSSYEYSITLLTQALRVREAKERIQQFQARFKIKVKGTASITGGDQALLESLAMSYMGLARAHALRGDVDNMWQDCQRVLSAARTSRKLLTEPSPASTVKVEVSSKDDKSRKVKKNASGGKRAWREGCTDNTSEERRIASNLAYRNHRLSELENEAKNLLKLRKTGDGNVIKKVAHHLLERLLFFSSNGTIDHTPSWISFGLSSVAEIVGMDEIPTVFNRRERSALYKSIGLAQRLPVEDSGVLNFREIFKNGDFPVDIEVGAGYGDWIVNQARHYSNRNFIAVELRADRLSQIMARGILDVTNPSSTHENLCVVGSECGRFLRHHIPSRSISTIFANHPEPPTQTLGDCTDDLRSIKIGGDEPSHMLNSQSIIVMANCLKPMGRIVIVTDNRWYSRFLSATIVRAMQELNKDRKVLVTAEAKAFVQEKFKLLETFGTGSNKVNLFEGQPNVDIGHAVPKDGASKGASYFDRLWKTGAGAHASKNSRFVLVLQAS